MVRQISVFDAQEIGGKIVHPLCEPLSDDNISSSVAAATNLIWFAMNIAIAKNDRVQAGKLGRMIEAIVEIEVEDVPNRDESDLDETMKRIDDALESFDNNEEGDGIGEDDDEE